MSEIDVKECNNCPFYEEFGAICKMYSYDNTSYSILAWQDKCEHNKLQVLKKEDEKLKTQNASLKGLITTANKLEIQYNERIAKLEVKNKELTQLLKQKQKEVQDFILDIGSWYYYDNRKPNTLYELQQCIEIMNKEYIPVE